MSFDKAIQHGKERRKAYRGSKRFDSSCRNHGDCPYCSRGRQKNKRLVEEKAKLELKEYKE